MRLFCLDASRAFGVAVAAALGTSLAPHEERSFEDGEHKARPLTSVRGADCFVVQSLHGGPDESPNDKLCRLLFFIATLKTAAASRVTAVIPYLAYARKDRQTKARDPLTARYVAQFIEAAGADRVVTMEVHNLVAFQNAFRCETVALDVRPVFVPRAEALAGAEPVVVASPDPGGVKRAQLFREALQERLGRPVGSALMEKRRSGGVVSGSLMVGEVAGARVLVVDDLVSSGGTMLRAAQASLAAGARSVHALAAHGLFTGNAASVLASPDIAGWLVTDTVPPFRLAEDDTAGRLEIASAAPLFAETIRRLHDNGSISDIIGISD
jgi:ribose-phosphate pyrophosphokinase